MRTASACRGCWSMLEGVLKPCLHRVDKPYSAVIEVPLACKIAASVNRKMTCHCSRANKFSSMYVHCSMLTACRRAPSISRSLNCEENSLSTAGASADHSAFTCFESNCCLSKRHRKSVCKGANLASLLHFERRLGDRGPCCLETCKQGQA